MPPASTELSRLEIPAWTCDPNSAPSAPSPSIDNTVRRPIGLLQGSCAALPPGAPRSGPPETPLADASGEEGRGSVIGVEGQGVGMRAASRHPSINQSRYDDYGHVQHCGDHILPVPYALAQDDKPATWSRRPKGTTIQHQDCFRPQTLRGARHRIGEHAIASDAASRPALFARSERQRESQL